MDTYIALLRGINVSGQKQIKMADLKIHFEELQFHDVKTYIQSGNLIFTCAGKSTTELEIMISRLIYDKYGYEVTTFVITPGELKDIISGNPFVRNNNIDTARTYITFLSDFPSDKHVDKLKNKDYSPEEYALAGKTIYFYSPYGYGKAKMNNNLFENRLKLKATTRNWKTVNKLSAMVS